MSGRAKLALIGAAAIAASATFQSQSAHAAVVATWNVNAAGNWANTASWNPAIIPGSNASTTSTDEVVFGTIISTARIVTVDANRNIFGMDFAGNSFAYTLSSGNLLLTNGGYIKTSGGGSAHTDTISSAIAVQGDGGSATFTGGSTTATRILSVAAVTGVSTASNVTTLTLDGANTGNNVVTGIIGDGANGGKLAIVKTGAGNWNLSGANTFSGGVSLNQGSLKIGNASALGATAGTFTISGGTTLDVVSGGITNSNNNAIVINGDFTYTGTSTLNLGTGAVSLGTSAGTSRTITVNASTLTLGGAISNGTTATQLIKSGAGTLVVGGNSTYTGGTSVTQGTLNFIGPFSAVSSAFGTGAVTVSSGATLGVLANSGGVGILTNPVSGAGNLLVSTPAAGSTNFALVLVNPTFTGNLTINNGATSRNTDLVLANFVNQTISGNMTSTNNLANNLRKTGTGTLTLAGTYVPAAGNYGFRLYGGEVVLDYSTNNTRKLSYAGSMTLAGGTLTLNAGNFVESVTSLSVDVGGGTNVRQTSLGASPNNGATLQLGRTLTRSVGGTLNFEAGGIASTLVGNTNGTLASGAAFTVGTVGSSDWAVSNATTTSGVSWSGGVVSVGSLVNGSQISFSTTAPTGLAINTLYYVINATGSDFQVSATPGGAAVAVTGSGSTAVLNQAGTITGLSSYTPWSAGGLTTNANYTLTGSSTLTAGGSPSTIKINTSGAGQSLDLATSNIFFGGGAGVTGGILFVGADDYTITSSTGNGTTTGTLGPTNVSNADTIIQQWGAGVLTINAPIINRIGANTLTKSGPGTLVLGAANLYKGTTYINQGTVSISANNNLGDQTTGGSLVLNNGTLQATGNTSFGLYNGTAGTNDRAVTLGGGGGTFETTGTTSLEVHGVVSDATVSTSGGTVSLMGSLTKTGSGTLLLSGTNTYTGPTSISAGKLSVASSGSINSTSGITINGASAHLNYNSATALNKPITFTNGKITGTGTIAVPVTVAANNSISPGNSPGSQTYSAGLTFANGGSYVWDIASATGTAGTDWDLYNVSGLASNSLNITSSAGGFTVAVTSYNGGSLGNAANFSGASSYKWLILDADNAISSWNAGKFTLNTSAFTNTFAGSFELHRGDEGSIGGDNSQLWITYTGVAPSTGNLTVAPASGSNRTSGQNVSITDNDGGTYDVSATTISGYGWSQTGATPIANGTGLTSSPVGTMTHSSTNSINGSNQGRFSFTIANSTNADGPYAYTLSSAVSGQTAAYNAVQTATILGGNTVTGYYVEALRDEPNNQLGNRFTISDSLALAGDTDLLMTIRQRVDGTANDEVTRNDANFARFNDQFGKLYSDVVNVSGIDGTVFVLLIAYNPDDLGSLNEATLRLGWLNTDINKWVLAVNGNDYILNGSGASVDMGDVTWQAGIGGDGLQAADLGKYGVYTNDTGGNYVWAVLNHNSEFAVIPEPASLGLLALGGLTLLGRRRRSN